MSELNFFCGLDALNELIGMEYDNDRKAAEISVDFIEAPFWFIFSEDEKNWYLKTLQRGEIFMHTEENGIELGMITINKETGEGNGSCTDQLLGNNIGAFFNGIRNLSFYAQENGLVEKFGDLDPEESGVLITCGEEGLSCEKVSGKDRPDLMCSTLFGGATMMRPYMDDFWERSEADFMSLEEKIEAAENGDEYIMEQLANLYLNGDEDEGVEPDPEKAVYWFKKLAKCDNSDAQFNLGLHYAKGHGVERDFEKAKYWMEKAAENGDEDATSVAEQYSKAAAAEEKLRHGNDAQAQADLASVIMALAGSLEQAGPGEDYALAFELAQKSAAQDNGDGIWALALCYEHGRGVEEDIEKAAELYQRGADLGHGPSMNSIAVYYSNGTCVDYDPELAFEYMLRAAEMGVPLAMYNVGRCYQFGNGVEDDMKKAIGWYEKYLEVQYDPELEQKVEIFKMLNNEEGFDFDSDSGSDDVDTEGLPDGYLDALEEAANELDIDFDEPDSIEFDGNIFALTGFDYNAEEAMTRKITENGGTVKDYIVKKTAYLVVNEKSGYPSSKYKKAMEQRIKGGKILIISGACFRRLTRNNRNFS